MSQTLNSHNALRYVWLNWRIVGIHPFKRFRTLYWCYSIVFNLVFAILHPLHLLAMIFQNIGDFAALLKNLSISVTLSFATLKALIIFKHIRTNLEEAREILIELDKRAVNNDEERRILEQTIPFCHRMYILYNVAYHCSLYSWTVLGYLRHTLVFEGLMPFDWTKSERLYLLALSFQVIGTNMQLFQNLTNDLYGSSYLVVIRSQFQALNTRIRRLGYDKSRSNSENFIELVQCMEDHKQCLRLFECLRPIISGTMFLQFLITAFILCLTAVYAIVSEGNAITMITALMYVMVVLIEVMPTCWFMNSLMIVTDDLTNALFQCNWYEQDRRFRQALIIFMQRSQIKSELLAGNLAPITLQTFLSVIKFAFSLFTLLKQMKS